VGPHALHESVAVLDPFYPDVCREILPETLWQTETNTIRNLLIIRELFTHGETINPKETPMENNPEIEMSVWRFGIISPLLHRTANEFSLCDMLEVQSENWFVRPDGVKIKLSPETIRKWLYRYNHGGLQALADQTRSNKGCHAVPASIRDAMAALRGEHPRWTLALLLETLVEKGVWDGKTPSRSVLYRYARAHNLMRDPHLASPKNRRTFQFEHFGQLWTADFMHGPKLQVGRKKRKSYLHVIIDDSTRYVVSGRFYLAENVESLIRELMTATRRFLRAVPAILHRQRRSLRQPPPEDRLRQARHASDPHPAL
jgi:hypothetical protein